jgi:hypothetical protein
MFDDDVITTHLAMADIWDQIICLRMYSSPKLIFQRNTVTWKGSQSALFLEAISWASLQGGRHTNTSVPSKRKQKERFGMTLMAIHSSFPYLWPMLPLQNPTPPLPQLREKRDTPIFFICLKFKSYTRESKF